MYFKKLEMIGFKSFMEKTVLNFEPGITAVVGPNGCGKSNIFDAIRWVLGEQSAKSLRGCEMQDVIFNGTDLKEPVSMAEVSLTFDNSQRFFNVEHNDVMISRKIFRSGECEYSLNRAPVRLKDILDLLMGTGIGAESYSIIAQGKIDLILSSRPEDRREVFDEASGITKYKAQKKEALRKLEETEQNLLRVSDIITEVKRQIGSLERQANKARKYKGAFEELKTKEINLALLYKVDLAQQKEVLMNQIVALEAEEGKLLNLIREQEIQVNARQEELNSLEDNIMSIKNQILNLESLASRNKERINFNQEMLKELEVTKNYLQGQREQTQNRLILDAEKLNRVKYEHSNIQKNIDEKTLALAGKETELNNLNLTTKAALECIANAKSNIMELATKIAKANNEAADLSSKEQISLARKKRLEIEKVKIHEEKLLAEDNLNKLIVELSYVEKSLEETGGKSRAEKTDLGQEEVCLSTINAEIEALEKQKLTLQSQKEFLERLKTKYEDISEAMNAVIYLDKLPAERLSGLVVKINQVEEAQIKFTGEAKPIDFDAQKINERIMEISQKVAALRNEGDVKENRIRELNVNIAGIEQELRNQEILLANKKSTYQGAQEQVNRIKDEDEIICMELADIEQELMQLGQNINVIKAGLSELERTRNQAEETISSQENNIRLNSGLKENILMTITQIRTEVEALAKRIGSDETTLKILQDSYQQDKDTLANLQSQILENQTKKESLEAENKDLEKQILDSAQLMQNQQDLLQEARSRYSSFQENSTEVMKMIEAHRNGVDTVKNRLYESQMLAKDLDFKTSSIKERILQAYKLDLESATCELPQDIDEKALAQEIQTLKDKLEAYGSVNLVAIEEYDELKKRYDFLTQQQADLICGKDALHEAITKINRTTRKMFLETFEKIRVEFRNYYRLLFNGGDAQIFLIDEHDPLDSGIEIICRPPGKKLQNVLLLSGGEKALSAIALIFAIFKVKPSPFCVLDEIDAALDEANVERFSRILQEFAKTAQFIVVTHNKRTIANANVMYGITMEESGVSKIVSVKFAEDKALGEEQLVAQEEAEAAEPVS